MTLPQTDPLRQSFALESAIERVENVNRLFDQPTHTERLSRAEWLPARARRLLTRDITRRNALDRALAEARGIDPASPDCARFQGPGATAALDRITRRRARAGLGQPTGAMAVAVGDSVEAQK